MHGCEAGFGCKVCVRNPDSLKSRDLDNYYPNVSLYEYAQSVLSISDSTTYLFDARNPSSGPVITSEAFSSPATQAQLEAAIATCANEPVAFKIKSTDTDSFVEADGVLEIPGEFESETLNVVNNTTTATRRRFSCCLPQPTVRLRRRRRRSPSRCPRSSARPCA